MSSNLGVGTDKNGDSELRKNSFDYVPRLTGKVADEVKAQTCQRGDINFITVEPQFNEVPRDWVN